MKSLPNILTASRIALLPVIITLFYLEDVWGAGAAWACLGLYALCAITDFLDGWLARKMNVVSAIGTFLDPISDKIFVAALLILLVGFGRLDGLWMLPVIVIFVREFLVSGLREFLGPRQISIPVSKLAKWKTAVQMLATGMLIPALHVPGLLEAGRIAMLVAALLTAITGWDYLRGALPHLLREGK